MIAKAFQHLRHRGVLAAILVVGMTTLASAQSAQLSQKSPDTAEVYSEALSKGFVRVIVQFETPISASQASPTAEHIANVKSQIAAIQDTLIAKHFSSVTPNAAPGFTRGILRFDVTPGLAVNVTVEELEALAADPQVKFITYDRLEPPTLNTSVPLIGMPAAYAQNGTGAGYIVAILDTGVQSNHAFLSGKVVDEACFSKSGGGGSGTSMCPNGGATQTGSGAANPNIAACINGGTMLCAHGTHVAGEAAGFNTASPTSAPPYGVAKSANIMAIQVFTNISNQALSYQSDQISALNYVFNHQTISGNKVAVANMSLGGGLFSSACDSDPRKASIDNLINAGILTAIAAGNDGQTNQVGAPGCISTALTVGSATKADAISSFSNIGTVVDVVAPGGDLSAGCVFGANNGNILGPIPTVGGSTTTYDCYAGTSMATPHTAGAVAAIKSACNSATPAQIVTALVATGKAIFDQRSGGSFTKSRIQVDQAITYLQQNTGCVPPNPGGTPLACSVVPRLVDYSGDGKVDILMRRADGTLAMYLLNGLSLQSGAVIGQLGPEWTIVSSADFDGDGKADILGRRSDGTMVMYLMDGFTIRAGGIIGSLGPEWTQAGVGDFNGDGRKDILFRKDDGTIVIYLMNGFSIVSGQIIGQIGPEWSLAGVSDFDGDGKADFLFRRADGALAMYLMNGFTIKAGGIIGSVGPEWKFVGSGDFNGDGKGDMQLRRADGSILLYTMNGFNITGGAIVGQIGPEWALVGVAGIDGSGLATLELRRNDGYLLLYAMQGFTIVGGKVVGQVGPEFASCFATGIR